MQDTQFYRSSLIWGELFGKMEALVRQVANLTQFCFSAIKFIHAPLYKYPRENKIIVVLRVYFLFYS
jgi:hypothetical protein